MNRRRFLKCASATAAVAYGFSRFPFAFGQEGSNEIDCGTVVTVPTFTGVVDKSWLGDTNDYQTKAMSQIIGQTKQYQMEGHLRTKFNDYTWFALEVPTQNRSQAQPEFRLMFDINPGKNEVYNLDLDWGSTGISEMPCLTFVNPPVCDEGTPFKQAFTRGTDYDWKYIFAPSQLSSVGKDGKPTAHPQFNVKIRTGILTKYSKEINFSSTYLDADGAMYWSSAPWGKLKFVQQALPEFGLKEAVVATALGAGLLAAKVAKSKKEWSRREFLRFPKAVTESLR